MINRVTNGNQPSFNARVRFHKSFAKGLKEYNICATNKEVKQLKSEIRKNVSKQGNIFDLITVKIAERIIGRMNMGEKLLLEHKFFNSRVNVSNHVIAAPDFRISKDGITKAISNFIK